MVFKLIMMPGQLPVKRNRDFMQATSTGVRDVIQENSPAVKDRYWSIIFSVKKVCPSYSFTK